MSDLRKVRFQFAGPTIPAAHWVTALEEIPGRPVLAYSVEILDVWPKPGCTRSEIAGSLSI
jgi:hypothetical protein